MPRYVFFGRILPERVHFSLPPRRLEINDDNETIVGVISVSFEESQFSVDALLSKCEIDLDTLKESIHSIVSGISDAYCFVNGYGYDVEITSAVDETGTQFVFGVHAPIVPPEPNIDYESLIVVAGENIGVRLALADLREGIRARKDADYFGY